MITLKIAIKNIFRHKTRTIITLSAIAFGCISLIFIGGFFENIFYYLRESYIKAHTGHIQVFKKDFFEKGSAEPFNYLIDNPKEARALIKAVRGVKFVTSRLEFSGLLSTGETTVSFVGQGIEPKNEKMLSSSYAQDLKKRHLEPFTQGALIEQGEPLNEADTYSVILGKGLASGINAKTGDGLILVTNTIAGSINALDVILKGQFLTSSKAFDDHFLRLPLQTVQKLLRTESVQSLVIRLDKTEDTAKVKHELEGLFRAKNFDFELKTWEELNDFYTKTVNFFNRQFLIVKIVIAIVVILSIFNTMNMAVLERTSEIGTIMALGTKRRGVLKLFLYEGLALGIIGGIIGAACGIFITYLISKVGIPMPPAPNITFEWLSRPMIVPSMVIFAFTLSVITSLISSLYPAYKASRLEIAEALRHTG